MARLWSSGAELQSVTDGVEFDTNYANTINTNSSFVRSGSASLKFGNASILNNDASGCDHVFSGGSTHVWARWYVYVDVLPVGGTVSTFLDLYSGATNVVALDIVNLLAVYTVNVYYNNFGASLPAFTINPDTWYRIEVEYDSTPANGSEVLRVYLDGVLMSSATNLNYTTKTVNQISQGIFNGSGSTVTAGNAVAYVDDLAVNDSSGSVQNSLPGDGKIVHLKPAGAGDNNTWQTSAGGAGSSTNYQAEDETTPDDATTYLKRIATTIKVDDYTVQDPVSVAGIGASDTVNVVAIGVRGGAISATASTGRDILLRVKSASGGTTSKSANSTNRMNVNGWTTHSAAAPKVHKLTSYTDPTTGSAWTVTGTNSLTNMQIGMENQTSVTTEVRVSTVWAMIDYTPASGPSALTPSVSDTVTVTESVSINVRRDFALSDSITVTEGITIRLVSYVSEAETPTITENVQITVVDMPSVNDAITATDVPTVRVNALPSVSDAITVVDAPTILIPILVPSVSDTVGVAESIQLIVLDLPSVSDAITITESVSAAVITNVPTNEAITVSEDVQLRLTSYLAVNDTVGVAEAVQLQGVSYIAVSDSVAVAEALVYDPDEVIVGEWISIIIVDETQTNVETNDTVSVAETVTLRVYLEPRISDAITTTDVPTVVIPTLVPAVSDAITVLESTTVQLVSYISVADTVSVAETVAVEIRVTPAVSDTITVNETIQLAIPLPATTSDAITVSESITLAIPLPVAVSDAVSIAETVSVFIPTLTLQVADAVSVNEAVTMALGGSLVPSDTINVTEAVTIVIPTLVPAVADAISVAEDIQARLTSYIAAADTVNVAESTAMTGTLYIAVADTISPTDVPTVRETSYVSVSDAVAITESITIRLVSYVSVSDTVSVAEAITTTGQEYQAVSESVTVLDVPAIRITSYVSVADTATLTDVPTLLIPALKVSVNDTITVTENLQEDAVLSLFTYDAITITEAVLIPGLPRVVSAADAVAVAEATSFVLRRDASPGTEDYLPWDIGEKYAPSQLDLPEELGSFGRPEQIDMPFN